MAVNVLDSQMKRLRRRVRLLMVERYALLGGSIGAIAAAVMVMLAPRYDAFLNPDLWVLTTAACAALGAAYGLLRKLDDLSVALAADKRTGLRERFSTAVALGKQGANGEMEGAVVHDADTHISTLRSRDVFRHRFSLAHILFSAALLVFLCAVILPMLPQFQSKVRRAEVAAMKREGANLAKIAKEIKREDPKRAQLKRLAARLQDLGKKMETGRMARKQAMLKTQKLNKEVKKEQDRLAKLSSPAKTMEQAQAEMKKTSEELAKQMAAKMAADKNIPLEEAMQKVPSDEELAKLVRKTGSLTPTERKSLEEALRKYTDPNSNLQMPKELGEALTKLAQNGDYQKAAEIMQQLAQKLGNPNSKMSQADKEALKKQMEALAQALKNTDLDKLAKAMKENAEKLAKMSPEELKKLAKQMQEAQKLAKLMQKAGAG